MHTAQLIRRLTGNSPYPYRSDGDAALYRLSPPIQAEDEEAEYVVVSAVPSVPDTFFTAPSGPETAIFSGTEDGAVRRWDNDLVIEDGMSHAAALAVLGYEITP